MTVGEPRQADVPGGDSGSEATVPGVPYQDLRVSGVRVEAYGTRSERRPPLLYVHGATQGSWAWENMAPWTAGRGWYSACLNWFGHNGSDSLPEREAVRRHLTDVATEIGLVADDLGRPPVIIAHSMGGLASLAYAARHEVAALVLLVPAVPAAFAFEPIDVPVEDPSSLWLPPLPMRASVFWDKVSPENAERYSSLLAPESPVIIEEGSRWTVSLDIGTVKVPAYVFAAERDAIKATTLSQLAQSLGAKFTVLPGEGHGIPLNPVWQAVGAEIDDWLTGLFG
ncbi:MAG TPA: alpha/beta fold hydrolase [Trebonia sp.]